MMTTEIDLYLEYARRDLRVAETNLSLDFLHITVSRAYYAMYYAASALLLSRGISVRKHEGVLSLFAKNFVKTGQIDRRFSKMLHKAFDARLDSDYDVAFNVDLTTAQTMLAEARLFVEEAEAYLAKRI